MNIPHSLTAFFASGHEVWIVSLNESVNNRGELNLDQGEGNGSFYGSRTMGYVNCRINKMIVKEHKESWIGGKSEVAIRAFLWTWNGATNGGNQFQQIDYYSQNSTDDLRGKVIREFKRGEVSDRTEKTVNYNLQNNWEANNYYINPICFGYAIFERDNWPVAVKTAAMTIPTSPVNTPRFMQFRSSDGQYSAGTVYNMPFTMGYGYNSAVQDVGRSNSFLSNRSGIRFNTQEF